MIKSFTEKYAFLSSFHPANIFFEGDFYRTSEHAYQAMKTTSLWERKNIRQADTPGKAKRLGKKVTLRPDWEEIKEETMLQIVRAKFSQNPHLRALLLKTGDEGIIEGNHWHDNTWGNCFCDRCKNIEGQNLLGKILMRVRSEVSFIKGKN